MTDTRTHIEQTDGTLWLCTKLEDDPYGRYIPGREYWISYCNGPSQRGVIGFYANSIAEARAKLAKLEGVA